MTHSRRRTQKGQAIVLVALMMAVLVGFVALAIDSARAFDGRRILQSSVDAAALAGAEYYQSHPSAWPAAEAAAADEFEKDTRLYGSYSCTASIVPTPGASSNFSMTCTMPSGSNAVLTITPSDAGPGGQSFLLVATRTVDVALMQVLSQSPTIMLTATASAVANDLVQTPAVAGLTQAGCFGIAGTKPVSISTSSSTPGVRIVGDVVSNGAFNIGSASTPNVAGNILTACSAPGPGLVNYYCWPSGQSGCLAGDVRGKLVTPAPRFADPGYVAPTPPGQVPFDRTNVVLVPGAYTTDPQFGSTGSPCYFLTGGLYNWQAGYTVNAGIISNELKPLDEPDLTDTTHQTRSLHQFWRDNGANCDGKFDPSSNNAPGRGISPGGIWGVEVTSVRVDAGATRESPPSMCKPVSVGGSDKNLTIDISNIPGATSYNVYAAKPPNACNGPFGLVGSITSGANEMTGSLVSCPDSTGTLGCSLGHSGGTAPAPGGGAFDNTVITSTWNPNSALAPDSSQAWPPSYQTPPFATGLPNQPAARAPSPAGDRANENFCAAVGGAVATCPAAVTPGAVEMDVTNGSCLNVKSSGDAYLFSGYQYNWILNYEPIGTTSCPIVPNTWAGAANSALIGMSYTPGAAFGITGNVASQSAEFGGVVAATVGITNAQTLILNFNKNYAPAPPGTRLTG